MRTYMNLGQGQYHDIKTAMSSYSMDIKACDRTCLTRSDDRPELSVAAV
jgi:hypothetical protein